MRDARSAGFLFGDEPDVRGAHHERGPEHSKVFTVEVRIGRDCSGRAEGRTKKIAAQRAARGVYERLLESSTIPAIGSDEASQAPGAEPNPAEDS